MGGRTARQRARVAWLTTQAAFESMAAHKSLSTEQPEPIVRRLLNEPLRESPTAAEVVARIEADDDAAFEILLKHADDVLPTLPDEDRPKLIDFLERFLDKMEIRVGRRSVEAAGLEAELQTRQGILAELDRLKTTQQSAARAQTVMQRAMALTGRSAATRSAPPPTLKASVSVAPVQAAEAGPPTRPV